jgi:hypothetical protein
MHSVDIWRVADGMVVEHWDQLDGQAFFAQPAGQAGAGDRRPGQSRRGLRW